VGSPEKKGDCTYQNSNEGSECRLCDLRRWEVRGRGCDSGLGLRGEAGVEEGLGLRRV